MPTLEILLASIYYLMTRYARSPDNKVSKAISQHLEMLSTHPDCNSEIIKNTGRRLSKQWQEQIQNKTTPANNTDPAYAEIKQIKLH